MKDVQRRLRSGSLLFCCVGRRMMAVRKDWRKNNIKIIWRVIFAEKFALTYWGKVSVLLGILWAERKDDLLCGGKQKRSGNRRQGKLCAWKLLLYSGGGFYCSAGLWEERGIVCLVSDTTLRHNTTFSIIYIFFFYSCNRTRVRIYTRIYRNRVSLVGCVSRVAQTGGIAELDFWCGKKAGAWQVMSVTTFYYLLIQRIRKGISRHIRIYAYI